MRIKSILRHHKHRFVSILECEHCASEAIAGGEQTTHYHTSILPKFHCHNCHKDSSGLIDPYDNSLTQWSINK